MVDTMFSLKNKTVLITGATGYLGRSMSFALAELGAKVLVNSRSAQRAGELVKDLESAGLLASEAVFDVSDDAAVEHYALDNKHLSINAIVNNAYCGKAGTIETATVDDYLESYNCSVAAAHRVLTNLLPNIRVAVDMVGSASVVNIASMYGVVSPDLDIYDSPKASNPPFYGASKAALIQWTRYAACEFGKEGIRVNSISPGPFPSKSVQNSSPEFIRKLALKVPLGRIGQAVEIGGPIAFLCCDASSYINGANLMVDGGWTSQ